MKTIFINNPIQDENTKDPQLIGVKMNLQFYLGMYNT